MNEATASAPDEELPLPSRQQLDKAPEFKRYVSSDDAGTLSRVRYHEPSPENMPRVANPDVSTANPDSDTTREQAAQAPQRRTQEVASTTSSSASESSSEPEPVATSSISVPDGNVSEVLAWVCDDPERARAAIEAEQTKSNPRSTLLMQLNDIAE